MPDVRRGLGEEAAEVTTVPKRQFSLPAGRQGDGRRAAIARPASSHIFRHTCAAICWKTATTPGPFTSFWATRTSARP